MGGHQHCLRRPIEFRVSTVLALHEALHAARYDDATIGDWRRGFCVESHKPDATAGR
jgi:hypothetical protein